MRGLYAISPPLADTAQLCRLCAEAAAGGARILQYRHPDAGADLRLEQAAALADIARAAGAVFIVNDDPELARAANADGVHLGENDPPVAAARRVLGRRAIVGVSCYNDAARVRAVQDEGADYAAVGAVFDSPTKPQARRCTIKEFAECRREAAIRRETALPLVAVGGITLQNAAAIIDAGADAVAVSAGLFGAADIRATAAAFSSLFAERSDD